MIFISKNLSRTEIKVSPKNWQTSKASIKKDWFIYYRLYDLKESKKGKLLVAKGMNHLKVWKERIEQTIKIISEETIRLDAKKLIRENVLKDAFNIYEIPPTTNFIQALELAEKRINAAPSTKRDLRSTLRYISNAAEILNYNSLPIKPLEQLCLI